MGRLTVVGGSPKPEKPRGDRGGEFFRLDRPTWEKVACTNRLDVIATYILLARGTGKDGRSSRWSLGACEQYLGMRRSIAQASVAALQELGVVSPGEPWGQRRWPSYLLAEFDPAAEPIFLPHALVTGLGRERPMLRRVRDARDPLLLRLLIDLYGAVEPDLTYAVDQQLLRKYADEGEVDLARTVGAHAIYAIPYYPGALISSTARGGPIAKAHYRKDAENKGWADWWGRVQVLETLGALVFEPWLFAGTDDGADPLLPLDLECDPQRAESEVQHLATGAASAMLLKLGANPNDWFGHMLLPLPAHNASPSLRWIARLRPEPDTPQRRRCYARRLGLLEDWIAALEDLSIAANSDSATPVLKVGGAR